MQETWVWYLGQEDPLEEEMATHSSILAWTQAQWLVRDGHVILAGPIRVIFRILKEWIPQDSHLFLLEFDEKWLEVAKYRLGHSKRKNRETESVF